MVARGQSSSWKGWSMHGHFSNCPLSEEPSLPIQVCYCLLTPIAHVPRPLLAQALACLIWVIAPPPFRRSLLAQVVTYNPDLHLFSASSITFDFSSSGSVEVGGDSMDVTGAVGASRRQACQLVQFSHPPTWPPAALS